MDVELLFCSVSCFPARIRSLNVRVILARSVSEAVTLAVIGILSFMTRMRRFPGSEVQIAGSVKLETEISRGACGKCSGKRTEMYIGAKALGQ